MALSARFVAGRCIAHSVTPSRVRLPTSLLRQNVLSHCRAPATFHTRTLTLSDNTNPRTRSSSTPKSSSPRARVLSGVAAVPLSTPTPLPNAGPSFQQLQIPPFLAHRLAEGGLHRPTTIQSATIPHLMRRPWDAPSYPDVLVQEMTGQGKTLSYLLPMLANIDRAIPRIQAIVVVPTRELAVQVSRVAQELGGNVTGAKASPNPLSVTTLIGSANPTMLSQLVKSSSEHAPPLLSDEGIDQSQSLISSHHPHLIVATPQVLHEIFVQKQLTDVQTVLPLTHLKYIVFDEVDAMLNSTSSRNAIVPIIQLRHQAIALHLDVVRAEQEQLKLGREERRKKKSIEELQAELLQEQQQQQQQLADTTATTESHSSGDSKLYAVPSMQSEAEVAAEEFKQAIAERIAPSELAQQHEETFSSTPARNQVVFVSATITPAVHQFAARYLSSSRAFLTSQSVAHALARNSQKSSDGSEIKTVDHASELQPSLSTPQRIPSHIRHYYLVINRPYDRQNSLQQLLQAIKFSFESWKKERLGIGQDLVLPGGVKPPSAAWIAKQVGPERALSAGGVKKTNAVSSSRYLKGGTSALGIGAVAQFLQTSMVFLDKVDHLTKLVNPLSKQGFQLGVVSERSGRHERREALKLEKGVELILATDVLSRGMDIKSLTHVINYHVPPTPNVYLHRSGRVGRLGSIHSKLASVVTLVDLQQDPKALQHLSRMAVTLGANLEHRGDSNPDGKPDEMSFTRLYVKKGKLYEDTDPESRITSTHVPRIEDFIADKESRDSASLSSSSSASTSQSSSSAAATAAAPPRKKEQSKKLRLDVREEKRELNKQKQQKLKQEVANNAAQTESLTPSDELRQRIAMELAGGKSK